MPQSPVARLLRSFLRVFFKHFYHTFAWTYDFVATLVSIGRWNEWIKTVLPFIQGQQVLEIGHGPGHLQQYVRAQGQRLCLGLDESRQMGLLARRRLRESGYQDINLVRAIGQALPFATAAFDTIVSTFPAEYIFEESTLSEAYRILPSGGRLIVVPAAWVTGRKVLDRGAAWLFKVTKQAPEDPYQVLSERLRRPFEKAGFRFEFQTIEIRSSLVLIVIASKE